MQQSVKQHRRVTSREHEAVTVRPDRIGGVEIQPLLPKAVSDGCHAHGGAWMAGLRFLYRINRKSADRVDAKQIHLAGCHAHSPLLATESLSHRRLRRVRIRCGKL